MVIYVLFLLKYFFNLSHQSNQSQILLLTITFKSLEKEIHNSLSNLLKFIYSPSLEPIHSSEHTFYKRF